MKVLDTRKERLAELVAGHKSAAAFARAFDLDVTYVRQLVNGDRSFGEKAARSFESKIGLPHLYFDFSDECDQIPLILSLLTEMDKRDRDEIKRHIDLLLTRPD